MTELIRIEQMKRVANGNNILDISQLTIDRGEILGIMGPNGAGKSTLLKALCLLESKCLGSYFFQGQNIPLQKPPLQLRRRFAIALQQPLLFNASVHKNVAIGLKIRNTGNKELKNKIAFWLDAFEIGHLAAKQAQHLSGGEAQRVNLARAFALEPEVLFLDEPFSALDYPTKRKLIQNLKKAIDETNTTVVLVSHDLTEIEYLTNRLIILKEGAVVQAGATVEVIAHPHQQASTFLSGWNPLMEKQSNQ
ncbi:ATP-binding cassette domain-containing protein [Bacillus canaveralius]|uniref:energy-coupling factor ABC transporter ATP-binding protein n=1 Tax=Bacillus canaveralius TaxID=1403243 RepID=UPI000F799355|nr:ATP-binding cassette domain-containing protein [Bacillus canaveralius]RSK55505.1 ATP-binding cassette domain-containing protein [Bacillus canaveralius]